MRSRPHEDAVLCGDAIYPATTLSLLTKPSSMDAFTVRDLRERTGELIRGAEEGKLSRSTS